MGQRVQVKWLDAWIENELTEGEIDALSKPQTLCILTGFVAFEDEETIGIAAEKVVGREEDISWRAITFVPKCLIIDNKEI
jgi:hypothetical protein